MRQQKQSLFALRFWVSARQPLLDNYNECKADVSPLFRVKGRNESFEVSLVKELLKGYFDVEVAMNLYGFSNNYSFSKAVSTSLSSAEFKSLQVMLRDLAITHKYDLKEAVVDLRVMLGVAGEDKVKDYCQKSISAEAIIHFFDDVLREVDRACIPSDDSFDAQSPVKVGCR